MTTGNHFRVLADYEVNDPRPLVLEKGDPVRIVRSDLSWPGWLWVEAPSQAGWIPEAWLEINGPEATAIRAFNGRDLSAQRGEILVATEEAPGWIHAENAKKETGWFPLFNLKPHQ